MFTCYGDYGFYGSYQFDNIRDAVRNLMLSRMNQPGQKFYLLDPDGFTVSTKDILANLPIEGYYPPQ